MQAGDHEAVNAVLATLAPGTELRDGLERIVRGRTGALIVLGNDRTIDEISTGGFELNVDFSATRMRELAKMDGAVVLSSDLSRIVRAATQLTPDPSVETRESGTRHRTAERVARQTGVPVVTVSASMAVIALWMGDQRIVLEEVSVIQSRANQALQTLERYKARLDEVAATLSALEIEDLVTVRDVAAVAQRLEMVHRIREEISHYVLTLGNDGRLVDLQLSELTAGLGNDRELLVRDYAPAHSPAGGPEEVEAVLERVSDLSTTDLLDLGAVAAAMGHPAAADTLDRGVSPWGYRLLSQVPRLPPAIVDRVVLHFDGLQQLMAASFDDLHEIEGIGEVRARAIREGLSRMAETSILDRYV
ncbi:MULTISPECIES: DNA integrity scanning diadenylate cyclase DisA [Kytococcus]|uniref:DNA integrity scanning diadenylate cyclase DisA n=1 Tax=Kytococcus TaxID=57499 RepID=UPI0008A4AC44|nr:MULTISPECIES: DNA integrity scanning diadenylate cyclase DisA [Kytococcus]OFS16029.1 DNA integrity scanning protein DisA [Kytococcus sp. HMSC28H12]